MKLRYWIFASTLCVLSTAVLARDSYRFKVDGRTVIKDHVPAEYAHLGYEVVDPRGYVLKRIPPALTAEQKAERDAQLKREEARQLAIKQRREDDLRIHRMYSNAHDIERVRQRKQQDLKTYLDRQEFQINDKEKKLEQLQAQAAKLERESKPLPKDLTEEWADTRAVIETSKRNIEARNKEHIEAMRELDEHENRLRVLKVYPLGTLDEDIDYQRLDRDQPPRNP